MENYCRGNNCSNRRGSAMVELALIAPFIALFIVVIIQFSALFHQAIANVAEADSKASEKTLRWEMDNANSGFRRPCLEGLGQEYGNEVRVVGGGVTIGFGSERLEVLTPQEVYIVAGDICQN